MTKKLHSYCFTTQLPLYLVKKKEKFYQEFLYPNRKIQSMPIGSCKNKPETCALFQLLVVKSEEC